MTTQIDVRRTIAAAIAVFVVLAVLLSLGKLFENVDAHEIVVIQAPRSGDLDFYTTAGIKWQGFGTVTRYEKRAQYSFSAAKNQGDKVDESLPVQFADGGSAKVSGVMSWEMPTDPINLKQLHSLYGSQHAVEQQLVRPAIERSLYLTGTLMTSAEAYSARKAEFLHYFEDQAKNGIYKTSTVSIRQPDAITGTEKTVQIVQIAKGADGLEQRSSESALKQFHIGILPPAIDQIDFDKTVKDQIAQQQRATMQVQTAQANAREAEQEAITTAKRGEAAAMKAKWEQEAIKAQVVTEGEQKLAVAKLETQAAEQYKQAQILKGEGDAAYKQRVMVADGALTQKLGAWVTVNQAYADAIKNYGGSWVSGVVMGQGSGGGSPAFDMMSMLAANSARQLSLDLGNLSARAPVQQAGTPKKP